MSQFSVFNDPENGNLVLTENTADISLRELETFIKILKESHQLARGIFGEPLVQDNFSFLNEENDNSGKKNSSDQERKNRIKKLNARVSAKEKRQGELQAKKSELEKKLKELETK